MDSHTHFSTPQCRPLLKPPILFSPVDRVSAPALVPRRLPGQGERVVLEEGEGEVARGRGRRRAGRALGVVDSAVVALHITYLGFQA